MDQVLSDHAHPNPPVSPGSPLRGVRDQLDTAIPPLLLAAGAPWATIAVRVGDETVHWVWNAPGDTGQTRPPSEPPLDRHTIVRWASLAKPIAALCLLRLVAMGRARLDDPAVQHSSSFHPTEAQLARHPPRSITLLHLLTHTSGMGVMRYPAIPWHAARPSAAAQLAAPRGPQAWTLRHAPGAAFTYGSAAFVWLQSIIEDLTGQPFEAAARTLLLDPLNLPRVAFLGDGDAPGRIAWGVDDAGAPITPRRSPAPAATGFFATPTDVTSLLSGLATPSRALRDLLGDALVDRVLTNHTRSEAEAWGLGWRLQDSEDGPVFRHAGWPDGVLAYVEGLPRLHLVTALEIGCAAGHRSLIRIADIARWHARQGSIQTPR